MGKVRPTIHTTSTSTTGTRTRYRMASWGLVRVAMITLPTSSKGTRTITRRSIITISVTCPTSFVRRVIRAPVSSSSRLPKERDCTLRNSVERRSAPKPWAASTAK
jgi:hypothetical protein